MGNRKRPPTKTTRHGNGAGWGGPRKGPGWGGPASYTCGGFGWGGPARGAHPAKLRHLPGRLDDRSLAELKTFWAQVRAYRKAVGVPVPFQTAKAILIRAGFGRPRL